MALVIDIQNKKKLGQIKKILKALEIDFFEDKSKEKLPKIKYTEEEFHKMVQESKEEYKRGESGTLTDEMIEELFGS